MEKWSFQRIRELMTHIALRGMAANELGRARISMMVRSISSNTRPDTLVQDRTLQLGFSLATHGGSIHWVNRDIRAIPACPVRPKSGHSANACVCEYTLGSEDGRSLEIASSVVTSRCRARRRDGAPNG